MKFKLLLLLTFLIIYSKAQDTLSLKRNDIKKLPKNSFYAELVGSTYGIGINYERAISQGKNGIINLRIGMGSLYYIHALPTFGINGLIGDKKNYFELGFNCSRTFVTLFNEKKSYWIANPIGGYRYIGEKGLIFRLSFSPLINIFNADIGPAIVPLFGVSFGKTFN